MVTFDFKTMDLKSGDTVSVFAEAIDNAPEPHLARSKTVILTVITAQEHNDFLREQADRPDIEAKYSKLVNDLRDLIEQQKNWGPTSLLSAATRRREDRRGEGYGRRRSWTICWRSRAALNAKLE